MEQNKTDRLNWILAGFTTLVALIIYWKTMAVSVSLWDCGEFTACARIFGIAHPPGTPLFVIFGRIFSFLPLGSDMAHRITFVSVISSAFSIGFSYLIVSKIISWWLKHRETVLDRAPMYIGGIIGSLIMAFSRTWWTNAVEAEVYGLTLLASVIVVYLALVWFERRENPKSDKLIFLMAFVIVLGVAAHLAAYLVMPAVFLFIFISSRRLLKEPRVWLTFMMAMFLAIDPRVFMYGGLIWLGITLLGTVFSRSYFWKWSFAFTLMMGLAFSVQFTMMVRADEKPRINMNNPHNFERMENFLSREQYGQGNMITRMFKRRGTLAHQFGDYPRMGMLGFWKQQYSPDYVPFALWLFVGLWGMYYAMKQHWKIGLMLFLLILIGTVGITLYMNFADGTQTAWDQNAKLEVRDRDYFWTHGFAMFGWAIGIGVASVLHALMEYFRKKEHTKKFILPVTAAFCLTLLLPVLTIAQNYYYNNRSGEWLAYDFSRDILSTCKPNAVLFTGGDNDTYPLWAQQEAYGYRQDVKIINLALANVDWYVLHCKNVFGAPMDVTDEQIEVKEFDVGGRIERRPAQRWIDEFAGVSTYFGSRPAQRRNGDTYLIEMAQLVIESVVRQGLEVKGDTMILHTPIYFTNRTDPVRDCRYTNFVRTMERVGSLMKFRDTLIVGETPVNPPYIPYNQNVAATYDLYNNEFIYRGMGKPEYARGEFATMMAYRYYSAEYADLIDTFLVWGDKEKAITTIRTALNKSPEFFKVPQWRNTLDSLNGEPTDKLFEYQKEYVEYMRTLLSYHPDNFYYLRFISEVLFKMGIDEQTGYNYIDEGISFIRKGDRLGPPSTLLIEGLIKADVALRDAQALQNTLLDYMSRSQDPNQPIFLVIADYVDDNEVDNLKFLLTSYFRVTGMNTNVFVDLMKYSLSRSKLDFVAAVQEVYFGLYPDDRQALEFIRQLIGSIEPQQDS